MTKPTDKYDYFKRSIELHEKLKGKIEIRNKMEVNTTDDLSLVYSPGVAQLGY
jgi:malate dehydrogenase (oxaloacetate-decarboxylating)